MEREMKSIWYFVGLMLLAMGIVVFASGVTKGDSHIGGRTSRIGVSQIMQGRFPGSRQLCFRYVCFHLVIIPLSAPGC